MKRYNNFKFFYNLRKNFSVKNTNKCDSKKLLKTSYFNLDSDFNNIKKSANGIRKIHRWLLKKEILFRSFDNFVPVNGNIKMIRDRPNRRNIKMLNSVQNSRRKFSFTKLRNFIKIPNWFNREPRNTNNERKKILKSTIDKRLMISKNLEKVQADPKLKENDTINEHITKTSNQVIPFSMNDIQLEIKSNLDKSMSSSLNSNELKSKIIPSTSIFSLDNDKLLKETDPNSNAHYSPNDMELKSLSNNNRITSSLLNYFKIRSKLNLDNTSPSDEIKELNKSECNHIMEPSKNILKIQEKSNLYERFVNSSLHDKKPQSKLNLLTIKKKTSVLRSIISAHTCIKNVSCGIDITKMKSPICIYTDSIVKSKSENLLTYPVSNERPSISTSDITKENCELFYNFTKVIKTMNNENGPLLNDSINPLTKSILGNSQAIYYLKVFPTVLQLHKVFADQNISSRRLYGTTPYDYNNNNSYETLADEMRKRFKNFNEKKQFETSVLTQDFNKFQENVSQVLPVSDENKSFDEEKQIEPKNTSNNDHYIFEPLVKSVYSSKEIINHLKELVRKSKQLVLKNQSFNTTEHNEINEKNNESLSGNDLNDTNECLENINLKLMEPDKEKDESFEIYYSNKSKIENKTASYDAENVDEQNEKRHNMYNNFKRKIISSFENKENSTTATTQDKEEPSYSFYKEADKLNNINSIKNENLSKNNSIDETVKSNIDKNKNVMSALPDKQEHLFKFHKDESTVRNFVTNKNSTKEDDIKIKNITKLASSSSDKKEHFYNLSKDKIMNERSENKNTVNIGLKNLSKSIINLNNNDAAGMKILNKTTKNNIQKLTSNDIAENLNKINSGIKFKDNSSLDNHKNLSSDNDNINFKLQNNGDGGSEFEIKLKILTTVRKANNSMMSIDNNLPKQNHCLQNSSQKTESVNTSPMFKDLRNSHNLSKTVWKKIDKSGKGDPGYIKYFKDRQI